MLIPVATGLALIGLVVLVFIQAPYRGLLKEMEQVQTTLKKQEEFTSLYERQKQNWGSKLRLSIIRVLPSIDADVPKVIFEMEMINYLPFEISLIKVLNSSGMVSAGELGSCILPGIPETIGKKTDACSEKQFNLEMEVGGTKLSDFLRHKLADPGQLLQWILKGEWYVEICGKTEVWQYPSYEIRYDQVIVKHR